ncbi:hypothetical protein [Pseudoxanthomonas indica]|uniref:Uncharacterized protein n=1 Tax=Pseudoxanthomonas indica TaxID=428993 RepID=A0A1T5JZV8_9GAMM|nr:hypothetical protein [Pseudoxanthomonas indica]SKC56820.1 hypothetical protein SAMN06296058_1222 [Pseudoxanthomonas indica]
MLRATILVLLTCTCLPALAQNGRVMNGSSATACQEIADKAVEAAHASDATRGKAVVRNKYSLPTVTTHTVTPSAPTSRGGGDDGDATAPVLSRPRGPKWHSFLPGMFR